MKPLVHMARFNRVGGGALLCGRYAKTWTTHRVKVTCPRCLSKLVEAELLFGDDSGLRRTKGLWLRQHGPRSQEDHG